jgi:hypothetical protein
MKLRKVLSFSNRSDHLCSDDHGCGLSIYDLPVPLSLREEWRQLETRRHFLGKMGKTLGWAGLVTLMENSLLGTRARAASEGASSLAALSSASNVGSVHLPNFVPKAKRCIHLFMSGAPPQMDLWDYKPGLADLYDKDLPVSVRGTTVLTGMTAGQARFPVAPSHWKFAQYGQSGRWVSDLLPYTAKMTDDLGVIYSLHTDAINHEPANLLLNTGNMVPGKPCLGSWLAYGLGSMNENLPTFVVLNSSLIKGTNQQPISPKMWSSGFLSNEYSGVEFRAEGEPVLYLENPDGMTSQTRRTMVDSVRAINQITYEEVGDPETHTRIQEYEMAFRMQTSVPELTDMSSEPLSTWELYGDEAKKPGTFAHNCLLARRMAERGVRFTQIYQRGWDVHDNAVGNLPKLCDATDRGCYALVTDLKRRGMLDDTLVIWAGEFGRTVYSQGGLSKTNYGRDHHPLCYTGWLAGGGANPGIGYGQTDDYCYNIVRDPVHVRDFNATLLRLLGIDHEKLTFKFQGLDQKLTGPVPASIVPGLIA